jgi:hypothetical protein
MWLEANNGTLPTNNEMAVTQTQQIVFELKLGASCAT